MDEFERFLHNLAQNLVHEFAYIKIYVYLCTVKLRDAAAPLQKKQFSAFTLHPHCRKYEVHTIKNTL